MIALWKSKGDTSEMQEKQTSLFIPIYSHCCLEDITNIFKDFFFSCPHFLWKSSLAIHFILSEKISNEMSIVYLFILPTENFFLHVSVYSPFTINAALETQFQQWELICFYLIIVLHSYGSIYLLFVYCNCYIK